jgi:hypothetical protein
LDAARKSCGSGDSSMNACCKTDEIATLGVFEDIVTAAEAVKAMKAVRQYILIGDLPEVVRCSLTDNQVTVWQQNLAVKAQRLDSVAIKYLEDNFDFIYPWMRQRLEAEFPV